MWTIHVEYLLWPQIVEPLDVQLIWREDLYVLRHQVAKLYFLQKSTNNRFANCFWAFLPSVDVVLEPNILCEAL